MKVELWSDLSIEQKQYPDNFIIHFDHLTLIKLFFVCYY